MDFDFKTQAGWQKFLAFLVTLIVTVLTTMGVTQAKLDMVTQIAAILIPIIAMIGFFIVNQIAAAGKATTTQRALVTKIEAIKEIAVSAPEVALALAAPIMLREESVLPIVLVKDEIAITRKLFGNWEGAKTFLLGAFGDRFLAALNRYAKLNNSTVEAVKKTIMDVVGVELDAKTCETLGQTPGFLGAMSAYVDTGIISDFFTAIDKTPEMAYWKQIFTDRAVWLSTKNTVDRAWTELQTAGNTPIGWRILQKFGLTESQAKRCQWSGASFMYPRELPGVPGFTFTEGNPWNMVGINTDTMKDI